MRPVASGTRRDSDQGSSAGRSRRSVARLPEIRGHARMSLMRDLALGEKSDPAICRTYGLRLSELPTFTAAYADEIAEIAQAIQGASDTALAGLWITRRQNRLAEMQADIDDLNVTIEQFREDDGRLIIAFSGGKNYQSILRTKLAILKSAAEEIDGPRRHAEPEDSGNVHYVIEADDFTGDLT